MFYELFQAVIRNVISNALPEKWLTVDLVVGEKELGYTLICIPFPSAYANFRAPKMGLGAEKHS